MVVPYRSGRRLARQKATEAGADTRGWTDYLLAVLLFLGFFFSLAGALFSFDMASLLC